MAEKQDGLSVLVHPRFEGDALTLEFMGREPIGCIVKPPVMRELALAALNKLPLGVQDEVIEKVRKGRKRHVTMPVDRAKLEAGRARALELLAHPDDEVRWHA